VVTPQSKQQDVQKLDANPVDPAFEDKAKVVLADKTAADTLGDEDLRKRLDAIRDLLASNKLSPETEKALRDKLAAERTILRSRMAAREQPQLPPAPPAPPATGMSGMTGNPPPPPSGGMGGMGGMSGMGGMTANVPPPAGGMMPRPPRPGMDPGMDPGMASMPRDYRDAWLRDRRPARDLREDEIRIRIDAYIDAARDPHYDDRARLRWRDLAQRDRQFLRDRLMDDRERRRAELDRRFGQGGFNIRLGYELGPDYRPPRRDVFAAEVDDDTLEDVLVAPPRQKPTRRYTVQDIEAKPEVRRLLPRVEIDTVHFGFNESFVREEEVGKLDRIASLMERILRAHPEEVFLIEGHTDAVGSDAYNLDLSRARAEAVKQALSTYYVIPARNLRTAGMGERYLRIPTAEAEPENRRVSVSRATDLIGRAR
jgi:outer membrane protein OmpA-like peptidoglycan-associated protein